MLHSTASTYRIYACVCRYRVRFTSILVCFGYPRHIPSWVYKIWGVGRKLSIRTVDKSLTKLVAQYLTYCTHFMQVSTTSRSAEICCIYKQQDLSS